MSKVRLMFFIALAYAALYGLFSGLAIGWLAHETEITPQMFFFVAGTVGLFFVSLRATESAFNALNAAAGEKEEV